MIINLYLLKFEWSSIIYRFFIFSHFQIILHEGPAPDQALPPAYSSHALGFNKSISSTWPTDSRGRFISNLVIHNVTHKHAGEYKCEPAASRPATITVHVQNGTDPQAVSDNGNKIRYIFTFKIVLKIILAEDIYNQMDNNPVWHLFTGDGISSGLNGAVRSGKNLVNTHTSFDSTDVKRQHNGAMLKDKYLENTRVSEDKKRTRNKGLAQSIETDITSGSVVPRLFTNELITIGKLWNNLCINTIRH